MRNLIRGCLHCIITRAGEVVPRPIGQAIHAASANEVIHVDYLYIGIGTQGKNYILIIRDDLSSYVWLWPTTDCTAESAVEAMCQWICVFGGIEWLVSDQGSHFKNHLLRALTDELQVSHHFTTAYSPWANGSVERVCREVLRACRALLSEWRMVAKEWPSVTEAVQNVLNHSPFKRLGPRDSSQPDVYRTPIEVF